MMKKRFSTSLSDKLLPVIDLMNGQVVMGVGGRRSEYQPIQSSLCDSSEPIEVAKAISNAIGSKRFYVADLDSLEGGSLDWPTLSRLADKYEIYLDANWWKVDNPVQLQRINSSGNIRPVFSSEGLLDWENAKRLLGSHPRFLFSLDLFNGALLGGGLEAFEDSPNLHESAIRLVTQLMPLGLEALIVLDVAGVGMGNGPRHLEIIRGISGEYPELELISGGGVRSMADVQAFFESGCQQVLVASSLHRGLLFNSESNR